MKITSATISKIGRRSNNEDSFKVVEPKDGHRWMGIVCDGMGGHAMGEVASETVINTIVDYWRDAITQNDSEEKEEVACQKAIDALVEKAKMMGVAEMGTTMVMASLENDTLTVAHVGDSRCYVQRKGEGVLYQTADHTIMSFSWELVSKCFFSLKPHVAVPEVKRIKVQFGDRILLCSDGLYKSMPPEVLLDLMMEDKTMDDIIDVYDLMCERNGDDNYTAIMAQIVD